MSLNDQEREQRAHWSTEGASVVGVLRSENTRGWREDRADLRDALTMADRGDYDVLSVYSIDRLARSVRILETVVHELAQHGVTIASLREPWAADPFMRQISGAMAERFTADLSARCTVAFAQRAHRGLANGTPAFGYAKVDKQLVPHLEESPVVLLIYTWAAEGKTTWQIAETLDALGLRPRRAIRWRPGQVRDVLVNPVYRGAVALNGEVVVEGAHPVIVCPELWHRVQAQRRRWPVVRRKRDPHWLEGLITHGCGQRMYRFVTKAGAVKEYPYFACKSVMAGRDRKCDVSPSTITAKKLERAVRRVLWADLRAQAGVSLAEAMERGAWLAGGDAAQRARAKLDQQQRAAMARRVNIQDGVEYGVYTAADAAERLALVDADLREIAADLAALPAAPTETAYRQAMDLMADWVIAGPTLTSDDLRVIIAATGGVVYGADGVRIAWAEPFAARVVAPVVLRP